MPNSDITNSFGQTIGQPVPGWRTPAFPPLQSIDGQYCRLEPLDPDKHADQLFAANALDVEGKNWTYLPYGPFDDFANYREWMSAMASARDPQFYALILKSTGAAAGVASYLRIAPEGGSIEVGHIHFSELLKQSPAATEAMFLMMKHAFDLGYRRYEWKCDALNAPSRVAALRIGLTFEGIFRQAGIYKGRNRDTAWFSAIDSDWPALEIAFMKWLDPANFDGKGKQRNSLKGLRD